MASWKSVARNSGKEVPDDPEEFRATLTEHLEELRTRVVRICLLILVGWVIGYYSEPPIYDYLNHLVTKYIQSNTHPFVINEAFTTVTDGFMLKFKLGFMLGVIP